MQNLDLNNYGVQEMGAVEMRVCDGGCTAQYNCATFGDGFMEGLGFTNNHDHHGPSYRWAYWSGYGWGLTLKGEVEG